MWNKLSFSKKDTLVAIVFSLSVGNKITLPCNWITLHSTSIFTIITRESIFYNMLVFYKLKQNCWGSGMIIEYYYNYCFYCVGKHFLITLLLEFYWKVYKRACKPGLHRKDYILSSLPFKISSFHWMFCSFQKNVHDISLEKCHNNTSVSKDFLELRGKGKSKFCR